LSHALPRLALAAFIAWGASCNRVDIALAKPTGPNVLLVTIDTLRADHFGPRGERPSATPTLDRLAAEGASFTNAIATVPTTLASHASILTGLYPPAHGVRHNGVHKLRPEVDTAAQRFQAAGYATGAFVAAAVLDSAFGLERGFEVYDDRMARRSAAIGGTAELPADEVAEKALAWLAETPGPFFGWIHFYDPHFTYEPPEPYRSDYAGDPYAGEIAFADAQLGRILDALRASGRYANTVVLVTADHGESLGEHGEHTHSYLLYEGVTRVPLILAGPGIPAGAEVDAVVSNASAAPTLVALAQLPALADAEVGDLSQLARGERTGEPWAYSEALAGQLDHGWAPIYAIRSERARYIEAPQPELYALDRDPREQTNLLVAGDDRSRALVAEAEGRIAQVHARLSASLPTALDRETREQIEALGYVVPRVAHASSAADAADPKDVVRYAQLEYRSSGLLSLGRIAEAERVTSFALTKLPTSLTLTRNLAMIYAQTQRQPEAIALAQRAVLRMPENPGAHELLGELERRSGDLVGAVAAFERAHALDPGSPDLHFTLFAKRALGAPVEELEALERAGLAAAGGSTRAFEACGVAWEGVNEYARAIAAYERGAREGAGDASRLHMRLATHAARTGDDAAFAAHIAQAGAAARDADLAERLGVVFAVRRETTRAEAIFRFLAMRDSSGRARAMLEKLHREAANTGLSRG
jgi:arylsulfatase A-like enzyme